MRRRWKSSREQSAGWRARVSHICRHHAAIMMKYFEQSDLATADNMHPPSQIKHRIDCVHFSLPEPTFPSSQY